MDSPPFGIDARARFVYVDCWLYRYSGLEARLGAAFNCLFLLIASCVVLRVWHLSWGYGFDAPDQPKSLPAAVLMYSFP